MAEAPVIEVKGITKRFKGLTAVNNVSFSIRKGGITGMIGPNGASLKWFDVSTISSTLATVWPSNKIVFVS